MVDQIGIALPTLDGQVAQETTIRLGELDFEGEVINYRELTRITGISIAITEHSRYAGWEDFVITVNIFPCEAHIFRCHRLSVGPQQSLAHGEGKVLVVVFDFEILNHVTNDALNADLCGQKQGFIHCDEHIRRPIWHGTCRAQGTPVNTRRPSG